ncbi:hypothetical protein BD94_1518 [Elizabethkingia anophelis NUHP1]|uniref:Uncharacterized protein n=2 Tax=Weeksellaceae TaxID=2762318 RepID=A0A077EFF4_9FLAO|nr:hypothetical protein BD94_1518 [Elizabethkingia anophelis NUHP1]
MTLYTFSYPIDFYGSGICILISVLKERTDNNTLIVTNCLKIDFLLKIIRDTGNNKGSTF